MKPTDDITGFGGQARLSNLIQDCERILSFDPNNMAALKKVGYAQWILGEFEAVIKTADRILSIDPADTDWLYSRAMANLALRNLELASEDLTKALQISTDARLTSTILDALATIRQLGATKETPTHAVVQIEAQKEAPAKTA